MMVKVMVELKRDSDCPNWMTWPYLNDGTLNPIFEELVEFFTQLKEKNDGSNDL